MNAREINMKAGLLLPRSNVYPAIAADLTVALRLCLKQAGNEAAVTFVSENISFGGSEKEVYDKAEKLLLIENVDVLIAYIDMKVIPILEPLIFSTGKLLIVLNAGANYPSKKLPQPGIIYLTQQHSFLCSKTGRLAGSGNGIYATTFYDCGYMHGAALAEGFTQAGGNILFNYINRDKYDESFGIGELISFLQTVKEDTLNMLCIFDEEPARLFYKKLNEYGQAEKLCLFVSPRMLTQAAIAEGSYRFGIEGYTTWLPQSDDPETNHFTSLFKDHKKAPSAFSLSGWQAGLLLNEILKLKKTTIQGEEIMAEIKDELLICPGASMQLDSDTNFYIAEKIYKCRLPPGAEELIISEEKTSRTDWDSFVQSQNDLPSSGWTNTYLCY